MGRENRSMRLMSAAPIRRRGVRAPCEFARTGQRRCRVGSHWPRMKAAGGWRRRAAGCVAQQSRRFRRSTIVVSRFARPRRRLRAGLLQLLCVATGLGLGLFLPRITTEPMVTSTRVTGSLVAVGFGILGLASIISARDSTSGPSSSIDDLPVAAAGRAIGAGCRATTTCTPTLRPTTCLAW
jgi:hypothetical protein